MRRIISEPTAAALAYGLHKKKGVEYILVVDLGICLVFIRRSFKVYLSCIPCKASIMVSIRLSRLLFLEVLSSVL